MTTSDYILLITALIALFYTYETHKMRKAVSSQLDAVRKTALLSAYASLFQINTRIVEQDCADPVARQMDHYKKAIRKIGESVEKLEKIIADLEKA
jgi:hypothetical protein